MYHTTNNIPHKGMELVIRIADESLLFARKNNSGGRVECERYALNGSVSMAANMREAFRTLDFVRGIDGKVSVLVDSNVLLVPESEFNAEQIDVLYDYAFSEGESGARAYDELSELSTMAIYSLDKEQKAAIEEHFGDVRYTALCVPVWKHFYQKNNDGRQKKLFGYFHDAKLEVFAFVQKRFKFCNSYTISHANDALYFLLFVWEQLAFDQEKDNLFIAGDIPSEEWLTQQLRRYIRRVSLVTKDSDQLPYDLSLFFQEVLP